MSVRPAPSPLLGWLAPMLGPSGAVPDVFETLAPRLADRGFDAICASGAASGRERVREQLELLHGPGRRLDGIFIHVYGGRSFGVADLLSVVARRRRVPLIGYLSGGSIPDLGRRHPRWVRRVLARFDLLSAPSPYMSRFADGLGLTAPVTPNPIDLAEFPYRRRPTVAPRLLWMRGFEPIYHPELTVEVLALVRRAHPEVTLTMAGRDRGLLPATRALAHELGVADAVDFPGFLDPAARLDALERHDVFLHTNRVDNTPLSLIQAASSGLAIAGTAVGGVPDLMEDGVQALLAPDGDADALAVAVGRFLDEPGLAVSLADAAQAKVQSMSLDRVLDVWVDRLGRLGIHPGGLRPSPGRTNGHYPLGRAPHSPHRSAPA